MRFSSTLFALLSFTLHLPAQDPDHVLRLTDDEGHLGAVIESWVLYSNTSADEVNGWSFGVTHTSSAQLLDAAAGRDALTARCGEAPEFLEIEVSPAGWVCGVIIDFSAACSLPPGEDYELGVGTYELTGLSTIQVCFTDQLGGSPPTLTVITVRGRSVIPEQSCGTLTVDCTEIFDFVAPDLEVDEPFDAPLSTVQLCDPDLVLLETQGFAMGLGHDPHALAAVDVAPAGPLLELDSGPEFFRTYIYDLGITVGVVYSFTGAETIPFGTLTEVVTVHYELVDEASGGLAPGECTSLTWVNTLGQPRTWNVMVTMGVSLDATFIHGEVCRVGRALRRGDGNSDGALDLADGIWILSYLTEGGPISTCLEACDVNDNGSISIADAVYVFNFLYLGGPPPPAPFPDCQPFRDDGDGLGCELSNCP